MSPTASGEYILGLSALAHDPAAALLGEKGIVAAIEESKLVRQRALGGIPRAAMEYCLERAGIRWRDLSYVAVARRPLPTWLRQVWLRVRRTARAPVASGYYQTKALGELSQELNHDRILRALGEESGCRVVSLEHHHCHAASAYFASPFDRALIVTLDEKGDGWSGTVALGEGTRIRLLRSIPFPHSLGWVYSQITELLGFTPRQAEHKTQWLSLEGEPTFANVFLQMLRRSGGPLPRIDPSYFNRGLAGSIAFSEKFYRQVGITKGSGEFGEDLRSQLASSVQHACSVIAAELAESFRKETATRYLCLSGGLFLNPLLVAAVEKSTGFEQVFVQPAAGNEGTALGAAWLVWHGLLGKPRLAPTGNVYWGPSFSNQETKMVLDNCKTRYRFCNSEEEKIEETLRLFEAGKIVAWYQGAAEFGPRALGNRSLLASPWAPYVKENLNEYVKHREAFRPFAIAVPEEDCARYFDCGLAGRFMATIGHVEPAARPLLEGFLLPGHRVRAHIVERAANPLFWRLLKRFGEHAPAPLLVNTSFNLFGEPLVISPRDAVRSFFCSGIDALVISSFILTKS